MKVILNILLLILSITLNAQKSKKIEIINADNTFANTNKHPEYWRLVGNVCFKHNNAIMYCDSAYHYAKKEKIIAFGKVQITQGDSIKLTGNSLTYFGIGNKADIKGNVFFTDKHMTLRTEQIFYNLNSNIAFYPFFGKIIDNEKIINSKKGEYHSDIHNFIFKDSVTVVAKDYRIITDNMHYNSNTETTYFFGPSYIISNNKKIYCESGWYNTKTNISQFQNKAYIKTNNYLLKGDSLFYDKNLGYGKAIKNVEVIDTLENITVFGGFAEYFEKEETIEITEVPLLQILMDDDTLFMHAKKFISIKNTDDRRILAYNKVKFFKNDLQGKCDSLTYNFSDSIVEMFRQPIIWSDNFQITSDSLSFLAHKGKIIRMFLRSNPMILSKEDSFDYNQIKGKEMTCYFIDNYINKVDINGNGQSIFFVYDDENNNKVGVNLTECTDMTLYFKNNRLDVVNYELKPNSVTTPYKDLQETNRYLKGFNWRGAEKPKIKDDIFIE